MVGTLGSFLDGGVLNNNPVDSAFLEAKTLFPGERINLIVSIGTGLPKKNSKGVGSLSSLVNMLAAAATASEQLHGRFRRQLRAANSTVHYYRLNHLLSEDIPLDFTGDLFEELESLRKYLEEGEGSVTLGGIAQIIESGN